MSQCACRFVFCECLWLCLLAMHVFVLVRSDVGDELASYCTGTEPRHTSLFRSLTHCFCSALQKVLNQLGGSPPTPPYLYLLELSLTNVVCSGCVCNTNFHRHVDVAFRLWVSVLCVCVCVRVCACVCV